MFERFSQWFSQSKSAQNPGKKRRAKGKAKFAPRQRRLGQELLERRELLAVDLQFVSPDVSITSLTSTSLKFTATLFNRGGDNYVSNPNTTYKVFLGNGTNFDTASKTAIGEFVVPSIPATSAITVTQNGSFAANFNVAQNKFFFIQLDPNNATTESSETNNVSSSAEATAADLLFTSLKTTRINRTDKTITYDYTLKNQGTSAIDLKQNNASLFALRSRFQRVGFLGFTETTLQTNTLLDLSANSLAAGASTSGSFTVGWPALSSANTEKADPNDYTEVQLTIGDVASDSVNTALLEQSTFNNSRISKMFAPDAQIDELAITTYTVGANGNVTFNGKIKNTGTQKINPGTYYYRAYLSANGAIDSGDLELANGNNAFSLRSVVIGGSGLLPGSRVSFSTTLPGNVDIAARPNLILQFDADALSSINNKIFESIEGNNARSTTFPTSDLEITSVIVNSVTTNSLTYNYTVKNNGLLPVNLATANLNILGVLSADTVFNNAGDINLGTRPLGTNLPTLQAGASYTRSITHTSVNALNLATRKNLGLRIDSANVISESNETNNTKFFDATRPDLIVSQLSVTNLSTAGTGSVSIRYTLFNNSAVPIDLNGPTGFFSDNVDLAVTLSADTVIGNVGDVASVFDLRDFPENLRIQPGKTYEGTKTFSLNPTGFTYLSLQVDAQNQIGEASETNNAKTVLLRQGDLEIETVTPTITTQSNTSLRTIDFANIFLNTGSATIDLAGAGSSLIDNVIISAYLSSDTIFSATGDQLIYSGILGGDTALPLTSGQALGLTANVTNILATDLAAKPYIILLIDGGNVIAESNELNNVIVADTRTLPDLTLTAAKVWIVSNTSITYEVTIKNEGTAGIDLRGPDGVANTPDDVRIRAYGSADQTISGTTDINFGTVAVNADSNVGEVGLLNPGESVTLVYNRPITATSFTPQAFSNLIVYIDPELRVAETKNNNNTRAAKMLQQDVVISATAFGLLGDELEYVVTVGNTGTANFSLYGNPNLDSDNPEIKFFLSTDDQLQINADFELDTYLIPTGLDGLLPGSSASFFTKSPLKGANLDDYSFLIVVFDWSRVVSESSLTNNTSAAALPVLA